MFTGLIEKTGRLKAKKLIKNMYEITIDIDLIWDDIVLGESIAVDGVCLTVTKFTKNSFSADISLPTLKDTTFEIMKLGNKVNLERSLKIGDRLGGHLVQGHVDGVGRVISSFIEKNNLILKISAEKRLNELICLKSSIAVNGVSLTVQEKCSDSFGLVIIPHSAKITNLPILKTGVTVNIEIDVLAKYVKNFLNDNKDKDLKSKILNFL